VSFCGFAICGPNYFFADRKLPQIGIFIIFLLTSISFKCSHSNSRTTFGFWKSFETELITEETQCMLFSLQICRFSFFGHQGNLRICDLRINHYNCADLQFADLTKFACPPLKKEYTEMNMFLAIAVMQKLTTFFLLHYEVLQVFQHFIFCQSRSAQPYEYNSKSSKRSDTERLESFLVWHSLFYRSNKNCLLETGIENQQASIHIFKPDFLCKSIKSSVYHFNRYV
jgi:hypothetical protein